MPRFAPVPSVCAEEGKPAVRARAIQQWLLLAERHDAVTEARLKQLIGEPTLGAIRDAAPLSWVPIELDVKLVEAVANIFGARRFAAFTRAFFLDLVPRPPLNALVDSGIKLMGRTPQSFLRWWGKGWEAIYKNVGTVRSLIDSPVSGRVIHERMPTACVQSEAFVESLLGSAYGVYAFTNTTGVVRVGQHKPHAGLIELEFEWRPRRASQRESV